MGQSRNWTAEETEYLTENWGTVSIGTIARKLNRTENAIKIRAQRMNLGSFLESGDYVSFNQVMRAIGYGNADTYKNTSWIQNRGCPIHHKKVENCSFKIVYLDEFWKWAEQNRCFIDFSRMEPLSLGKEPPWVVEQRKADFSSRQIGKTSDWTEDEDSKLRELLKMHKYSFLDLCKIFNRTSGAIQKRCGELGLKERPVRVPSADGSWSESDLRLLTDGIKSGKSYIQMSHIIGKSDKAIRGKVYSVYLTERLDSVRGMMNNGEFGDGRPEPTVKQALVLSAHKAETRHLLEDFASLLQWRLEKYSSDVGEYWQRSMCQNWNPVTGKCPYETDCDICSDFQRIRPQYCKRCGGTFIERKENEFCPRCRSDRMKQAQKHWARVQDIKRRNGV